MENEKLTIWQRLSKGFGPDSLMGQGAPSLKFDKEILLKTVNKDEYEKELLQARQTAYIANQWSKIEHNLYTQSVYYEPTRLSSYYDFEGMEQTPEIASALDTFAEESTTPDQYGVMLQIYSESKRIKSILTDLFNDKLDINTNLPMWTRNTPIREDSIIPLLDGTEVTIKNLSNRIKSGEEIWTYSIQDQTKAIVPGKIIWCDLTRRNSELIRVTLDDGTYIDTTPDHEYMLRNGSFKRADELISGQSLMPFYSRISEKKKDRIVGYEKVYNPLTGKYKFTHTLVAHECIRDLDFEKKTKCQFDTHHIDFNKLNNHPKNLTRMDHSSHFKLHAEHYDKILGSPEVIKKRMLGIDRYLRSDERREKLSIEMKGKYPIYFEEYNNSDLHIEHNKIRSSKMLNNWQNEEFIEKTKKGMTITISDDCLEYIIKVIKSFNEYVGINKLAVLLKTDDNFINLFKVQNKLNKDLIKSINSTTLHKTIKRKTGSNYFDFLVTIKPLIILDKKFLKARAIFYGKTKILNHKVISVTKLSEKSDVYCMEVVGPKGESDRHNFPVCGKNNDGNHTRNGVFLSNCKYGDNFVFLKLDPEKGVVGCMQLPNIEIERVERGMVNRPGGINVNDPNPKQMKFHWKNKQLEFNTWEIVHFRLLGDDRKLPYGSSILEKARRIWRLLVLAEDAMLVYRTSRAPERRVFKVFVGNMDDKDVEAYVQRFANKFKRDQVSDQKTGNVDLRYNQMAVDQDYFVPVRDVAAPMPIDTLPGAQNLDAIQDIEYIQKKLLTALRIPKAFLGFEEVVADGKNLALQDIRFARTINRVQKSMLAELNKIAIIHLFLLGFEDELSNFTLGLTNPSTQADLLKVDVWKEKVLLYRDAVTPVEGIAPTSHSWAKKHVLGFSDEEIKLDIQQQRIEKAVAKELEDTPNVIVKTGIFDSIDAIYGQKGGTTTQVQQAEPNSDMELPDMSLPSGGGGDIPNMSSPEIPAGGEPTPEVAPPTEEPTPETVPETIEDKMNILLEGGMLEEDEEIDLGKARIRLNSIQKELDKLIKS